MDAADREAVEDAARREALERVRLAAPVGAVILLAGVFISGTAGVPLSAGIVAINVVDITLLLLLAQAVRVNKVPLSWAHVAAAGCWLLLPATTLGTIVVAGKSQLALAVIATMIVAPWLQLSRAGLAVTTGSVAAVWWMIATNDDGMLALPLARMGVACSAVAANLGAWLLRRLFVQRTVLRVRLDESNRRVQSELRERLRGETERADIQNQFIAAQRGEALGSLSAGLAHEMNNILTGILTTAELAAEEIADPGTAEMVSTIAREAQRGGALTQSLLAFARRGEHRRAPSELDAIADEVVELVPRSIRRGVEFRHTIDSRSVVNVDHAQLVQAILNLTMNAADAMPDGGALTLHTGARTLSDAAAERIGLAAGAYAIVEVTDTGHGMNADTRRRAFEPFFTTKPPGKGTGLGLAMVDGTVRAHGGSLEVESEVGRGTTVRLFLPIHRGAIDERSRPELARGDRQGRALVVDDEPLVREATSRLLERLGLAVSSAPDGKEALAKLEEHPDIVLIVCDIDMPVMGGPAFVRAVAQRRSIPILLVSGFAREDEVRDLLDEGLAHAFVGKPFTRRSFLAAVDAVLSSTADEGIDGLDVSGGTDPQAKPGDRQIR